MQKPDRLHRIFLILISIIGLIAPSQCAANDNQDSINYYLDKADIALQNESFVDAINLNKTALNFVSEKTNKVIHGQILEKIGFIYFQFNDFENTLKYYLEALAYYEQANDLKKTLDLKRLIGDVYIRLEQCDLSFKFFKEILAQQTKIKNKSDRALLYQSVGIAYGRCISLDSALHYFKLALVEIDKPYKGMLAGGILNNIGAIYSKKDMLDEALKYYDESRALFERENSKEGIAVSMGNHAYILMKEKRFKESAKLFEEALELFKETNSLIYLRDNYLNIAEVYEELGDYKKALEANNNYLALNDSISNIEILSNIADLNVQFEIKKKDQEVLIEHQKRELAENENQRSKLILIFTALGLILTGIIVFLFIRNLRISLKNTALSEQILRQEKEELTDEVKSKSSELEDFAMRMVERNNLLEELKQEIHEVASTESIEETKLKDIERTITDRLYIENDRKQFEYNLNQVHQSFLSKLSKKHPELTKSDTRLCSLLMMDLTTKEMAIILNISIDGVKKRRHRLRKKMQVESDADLKEFLKNL